MLLLGLLVLHLPRYLLASPRGQVKLGAMVKISFGSRSGQNTCCPSMETPTDTINSALTSIRGPRPLPASVEHLTYSF